MDTHGVGCEDCRAAYEAERDIREERKREIVAALAKQELIEFKRTSHYRVVVDHAGGQVVGFEYWDIQPGDYWTSCAFQCERSGHSVAFTVEGWRRLVPPKRRKLTELQAQLAALFHMQDVTEDQVQSHFPGEPINYVRE